MVLESSAVCAIKILFDGNTSIYSYNNVRYDLYVFGVCIVNTSIHYISR